MQLTIRGTQYTSIEGISLVRNGWMIRWAREAGLLSLVTQDEPTTPEAAKRRLEELITDAFANDAVVPLLAGVLVPVGKEWTPALAAETMADIGLAKDEEAALLLNAFGELVVGFLKRAPAFWASIGRSLPLQGQSGPTDARGAGDSGQAHPSPTPAAAASTTSPGTSPATTRSG